MNCKSIEEWHKLPCAVQIVFMKLTPGLSLVWCCLDFRNRLNKSFAESMKPEEVSGICIEGDKDNIKEKMKQLCRTGKNFLAFISLIGLRGARGQFHKGCVHVKS